MKPLLTMSAEEYARVVRAVKTPQSHRLVDELDAQRAETPREPVEELTRERDYLREVVSGQAARISEIQRDAVAVRQEAIDQCIAIVAASSIHGHSVVEPVINGAIEKLEALRDQPGASLAMSDYCRVYWGSHGCDRPRGHDGHHRCECADHPGYDPVTRLYPDGTKNVGAFPYYGPETRFYGEDAPKDKAD